MINDGEDDDGMYDGASGLKHVKVFILFRRLPRCECSYFSIRRLLIWFPMHPRSLISAFVIRFLKHLNSMACL